ncbi:class I SAM-dependent methyltransferase [Salipiger sp. P9]|uniref:class I SAM-dependent DNA methyltransferase n=1 Tax=Salipiger pentaromativorans TaxID=2943193 RepID=UPI0021580C42|nr:class I SAM-dependent methyltransferase [Salipiger pentaromativorans]
MSDDTTLNVYNARAADYAALAGTEPYPNLCAFIAALPERAHVLDLGCGPGLDAAHMAAAGFSVEAMDASAEMVKLAETRPGVTARQGQFADLTAENAYDGIWASFSLLHAPRADMQDHLAAIARALRPGGLFGLTLKEGTGEKRDRLGRFYTFYTEPELRGLLAAAGLEIATVARGDSTGLDGTTSPWISLTAHA